MTDHPPQTPADVPAEMTREQVDAEFKDVQLSFHSYYKFSFTFVGTSEDGKTIEVSFGGIADDIYKFGFKARDGVPFVECGEWMSVRVFSGKRKVFALNPYVGEVTNV